MVIEKAGLKTGKDNFLYNLRSKTSHLHTQLEQLPLSLKLINTDLSIADYIHYLRLMEAVIEYTEKNIFPLVKDVIPDPGERRKLQFLEADLEYLQATAKKPVEFSFITNEPIGTARALGILYVIEGSTLGGRVILKNVQPVLGLTEEKGASYFACYQHKTGNMWKEFLDMLVSYQIKNTKETEIITGANIAFKSIYNLMQ